jgi:ribosome-binding factor A
MRFRSKSDARRSRRAPEFSQSAVKSERKVQQLCRQVERALAYVVPGALADPVLQDLSVAAVRPAPDASRLMIWLRTGQPVTEMPQILERLERVRGLLRSEVAAAVTRKRAPELAFHLLFSGEVDHA